MTNKAVFGIDIGGTSIKCGLFSDKGELLDKSEIPTRKEDNGSHILDDITSHIKVVLERFGLNDSDVAGIGLGVPGSVKNESVVNKCINLGWGVVDVAAEMRRRISIPVKAGNDANLAALGEYWKGGAKGCSSMIMVTLGTGVGGGYILNGKPVEGFNGAAAELGHFPIVAEETEYCNCGKKGCLEQVASATGIVRTAKRYLKENDTPSLLRENEDFSAKDVFDAAKLGDKLAVSVTEYTAEYLAKGLACAAAVADPECFVIGGGVSAAGDYLIDLLVKYYKIHVFHPSRETKILRAELGNDAGMYGAAGLMIKELE